MGVAMGNLARLEFEPDTMKSNAMSLEALNYLRKVRGTEEEMATILINIGYGFKNPDSALYYYSSALALAENAQLPLIIIGAYNNMAYSYMDKGEYSKAESCVRDFAIPIAEKYDYTDWLSSLYDTYSDVCVGQGDIKMALSMQKKALKFRVADYRKKASDRVQLLAAVLDLKNKELIIQNEEKKILIQKNQLQNMELWLAITAILVILSVFVTMFLHHRNKVKIQKEKITSARRIIEMEESEKGRIARELHDLTGQLVLGISGMIENIEFSEPGIKQLINDRIKELGGAIRHISHRMNRAMIEHFTFSELITGLCLDVQKLAGLKINLQIPEELPELPNEMVLHFYRIVQELLTNAGKYAKESPISIVIAYENESLTIHYEDQGPGFIYNADQKTGMGLLNIFERVKLVNGKGTVHSEPGIGTKWDFSFPVNEKK
jgi:signal transduction histidine kinase